MDEKQKGSLEMTRKNKSIKNIVFALGLQLVTIVSNFIIRSIMIKNLGMEATSLNGLFTEVLAALSMAEMGVGTAIVYNLYKPLAENDHKKVCQLMGLFRDAYRLIALVTFGVGAALCPWIHLMITSIEKYDLWYIRVVYMLFVADLAMSYLFSYKVSLMNADQKNYIQSKASILLKPLEIVIKISVLLLTNNYVLFLCSSIFITLVCNIIRSYIVDRHYPWLAGNDETLPKEERKEVFSNIKNLFIKALSGKITNSTDNILISTLVDTLQVGYYGNYSLPMGVFRQVANQVAYGGIGASLGNMLVTESKEKCVKVFYRLEYLFFCLAALSAVCVYCCIDPFILIWLKSDEFLLGRSLIFICCLNLFIEIVNRPLWSIMEVSGLFQYDKYVSIIGSVVNLIVSICLGMQWGMSGIFLGTFMTYLIQSILKVALLFKIRLEHNVLKQYIIMICMQVGMLAQMFVADQLCQVVGIQNKLVGFVGNGCIAAAVVIISTIACTFFTDPFHYYLEMVVGMKKNLQRRKSNLS